MDHGLGGGRGYEKKGKPYLLLCDFDLHSVGFHLSLKCKICCCVVASYNISLISQRYQRTPAHR